jgi:hypothetical protein
MNTLGTKEAVASAAATTTTTTTTTTTIWEGAFVALSRYYPGIWLEGLIKTTKVLSPGQDSN